VLINTNILYGIAEIRFQWNAQTQ